MSTASSVIVACAVAWLVLVFLLRQRLLPATHPNHRSLHRSAVARGAGLAIWAGVAAGALWSPHTLPWAVPLGIVIAVSFWDDRRGMPILVRLASQIAAALAWMALAGAFPALLPALLTVLVVVWMANLYNFMDGSDGLAAMMTLIGFAACAMAAWRAEAMEMQLMVCVVAATLPFMIVNWPPARAFLGDVGAVPLGFLAGALGIEGWRAQWWPGWFPILVFLPFIADATATLARRVLSGERAWEAHCDHYYQRLVRRGLGHSGTLALYSALMLGTGGSALAALMRAPAAGSALLALWVGAMFLLFAGIDYGWRAQGKAG